MSDYVNASSVCDAHNTDYIITQAPSAGTHRFSAHFKELFFAETTSEMWQMIWEQGAVVIVNLTRANEGIEQCRYWPETGNVAYGDYEVLIVQTTRLE